MEEENVPPRRGPRVVPDFLIGRLRGHHNIARPARNRYRSGTPALRASLRGRSPRGDNRPVARRVYVPRLRAGENPLDPAQAHHARNVLRLTDGAQVEAFDDAGRVARGVLALSSTGG